MYRLCTVCALFCTICVRIVPYTICVRFAFGSCPVCARSVCDLCAVPHLLQSSSSLRSKHSTLPSQRLASTHRSESDPMHQKPLLPTPHGDCTASNHIALPSISKNSLTNRIKIISRKSSAVEYSPFWHRPILSMKSITSCGAETIHSSSIQQQPRTVDAQIVAVVRRPVYALTVVALLSAGAGLTIRRCRSITKRSICDQYELIDRSESDL